MTTAVYPSLLGLKYPIKDRPQFNTVVDKAAGGNSFRTQLYQFSLDQFELAYDYLSLTDYATLKGFYKQMKSGADAAFYFDKPDDDTVSASTPVAFASTDGVTQIWTVYKATGNSTEPIGGFNGTPTIYLDGNAIPAAGIAAPGSASLSQVASGALAATTYFVKITWLTAWGETTAGTEISLAVSVNNVLKVTQPSSPPAGAIAWNVYVSNTAGGGSGAEKLQTTGANIAIATTTWQEPNTGLAGSTAMPGANSTGWSMVSTNNGVSTNAIQTGNVSAAGHVISWSGAYYYLVRFVDDVIEFGEFAKVMWENVKVQLEVVY